MDIKEIMLMDTDLKERLNHEAYVDVLDGKDPSNDNEYYLHCYRQWSSLVSTNEDF